MSYHRPAKKRDAFTLLELLLVLAIFVTIAGLAAPSVASMLRSQRLKGAAEQVRAEWSKARTEAMRSGRIQIFRCFVGTGKFRTDAWYSTTDAYAGSAGGNDAPATAVSASGINGSAGFRQLPDGVLFHTSEVSLESRDFSTEAEIGNASTEERRVFFYPDGTTATAQLIVADNRGRFVTVSLRGLTGVSTISDVQSAQSMPGVVP